MSETIRVFCGYDQREAVGWHVFASSVIERADRPVEIIPLTERIGRYYGVGTDGTNAFTKLRFLIPHLCGFRGFAIWLDGADMLLRGDLLELLSLRDEYMGLQVVKHDYKPKAERKYIGTAMEISNEAYPRKNWSSLIIWNCGYYPHRKLTPEFIQSQPGSYLHRFEWMPEHKIGELPKEWNWLDEYELNDQAQVQHYTNGIPAFRHYREAPHAGEWFQGYRRVNEGLE